MQPTEPSKSQQGCFWKNPVGWFLNLLGLNKRRKLYWEKQRDKNNQEAPKEAGRTFKRKKLEAPKEASRVIIK